MSADYSLYKGLHPTQRRFLRCFEACGSIVRASRWAKIVRQNHYNWLEDSEEYRKAFEQAEIRACRALEDGAVQRAYEGVRRAVRYKGRVVGYDLEYSDSLMALLLKKGDPRFRGVDKMTLEVDRVGQLSDILNGAPDSR